GLLDKKPDDWVSAQVVLDIYNVLDERGGAMLDYVAIGMIVGQDVRFPDENESELSYREKISQILLAYPYFMRGTDIGYIQDVELSPQHLIYKIRTPFPDDIWYGIIYGFCKRFMPATIAYKVYYDANKLRFEQGGEETL